MRIEFKRLLFMAITICCIGIIAGTISGIIDSVFYISSNKYVHYKMYMTISVSFLASINRYIIISVIICFILFCINKIFNLLSRWIYKDNECNYNKKHKKEHLLANIFFFSLFCAITLIFFRGTKQYRRFLRTSSGLVHSILADSSVIYNILLLTAVVCLIVFLMHHIRKWLSTKSISLKIYSLLKRVRRFIHISAFILLCIIFISNCVIAIIRITNKPARPNVILISIETLRRDHLGCYGYYRNTTPHLDRLAHDSVLFENAIVPRGITSPSVTSFLTGYYPRTHGVRTLRQHMDQKWNTLAEFYQNEGYDTAAFICNSVLINYFSGLANGFDLYNQTMNERESKFKPQRIARKANEAIFPWLNRHKNNPFFLWVHYMDPHGPYAAPETFENFPYTPQWRDINDIFIKSYMWKPLKWNDKNEVDVNQYIREYDKEIRYVDEYIGKLITELKRLHLYNSSYIIVTADHGEMLTDHDKFFRHEEYVYEATVHVPLLFKLPTNRYRWFKPGTHLNGQVSSIDIVPTLLELSDIKSYRSFDGKSLVPMLKGEIYQTHKYVYLEENIKSTGIRTNRYKYVEYAPIYHKVKGKSQFFDLSKDPNEQNSIRFDQLSTEGKQEYRILYTKLQAWKKTDKGIDSRLLKDSTLDRRTKQMLKSLGYVN